MDENKAVKENDNKDPRYIKKCIRKGKCAMAGAAVSGTICALLSVICTFILLGAGHLLVGHTVGEGIQKVRGMYAREVFAFEDKLDAAVLLIFLMLGFLVIAFVMLAKAGKYFSMADFYLKNEDIEVMHKAIAIVLAPLCIAGVLFLWNLFEFFVVYSD